MKGARMLYWASGACLFAALTFYLTPSRPSRGGRAVLVTTNAEVARPRQTPALATSFDSIVLSNVFSRSRSAPLSPVRVVEARPRPPAATRPALTLRGTTIGPHGAVALIDGDRAKAGAEVHRIGDIVDGARLVSITDSSVTLQGTAGPFVLHLPSHQ